MKSHDCVCPSYHGICDWFSLPLFYPKFNVNLLNVHCFMCTNLTGHKPTEPERKFETNEGKKTKWNKKKKRRKNREQARERVYVSCAIFYFSFFLSTFFLSFFNVNILNLLRQDSTFRVRFLFHHQMLSVNKRCYFFSSSFTNV